MRGAGQPAARKFEAAGCRFRPRHGPRFAPLIPPCGAGPRRGSLIAGKAPWLQGDLMRACERQGDRHVYLVQPRFPPSYWGLEHFLKMTPFRAVFPPLGLLTLAALAPAEFDVTICDENAGEDIDYDTDAQI